MRSQYTQRKPSLNSTDMMLYGEGEAAGERAAGVMRQFKIMQSEDYRVCSGRNEAVRMLIEAFPNFDAGIIKDIYAWQGCDLEVAAEVLSEFSTESTNWKKSGTASPETVLGMEEVTAEWIMVRNEWEVVDNNGNRVPTYSEVVSNSPPSANPIEIERLKKPWPERVKVRSQSANHIIGNEGGDQYDPVIGKLLGERRFYLNQNRKKGRRRNK